MVLFNLLVRWEGLPADTDELAALSINLDSKLAPKVIE